MSSHKGFLYSLKDISLQTGVSSKIKALIDSITFYDALWLQGVIQLFLIWGIKWCLIQRNWNYLVRIVIADIVIATLLNLPFTGVGQASVTDVQRVLNKSPKGIPIPMLQPVTKNDTVSIYEKGLVGNWSFYNKQIGSVVEAPYPIRLNNTIKYFDILERNPALALTQNDYLFSANLNDTKPVVTSFTGNKIAFTVNVADTGKIIYQQAFYPYWSYDNGKEKKEVQQTSTGFIEAPIAKGENKIEIAFEPQKIKVAMLISLIFFSVLVILLLINPAFIRRSLFPS